MTPSDRFREALSSGNIGQALTIALGEAIELEITTWVVERPADDSGTEVQSGDRPKPPPGQRMMTRINIVDGDIENEIGRDFIDGPYAGLRDFHLQEVDKGVDIIKQNLENLQNLFETLSDSLDRLAKLPRSRPQTTDATVIENSASLPPGDLNP